MRRPELAVAIASLALSACGSFAVPEPPRGWSAADATEPLSRADCVHLARENATTVAVWNARLDRARADLRAAWAPPAPSFATEWEDLGVHPAPVPAPVQTTYSLGLALGELFTMPWRIAAARHARDAAIADRIAERARLAGEVNAAYDGVVTARRRVALAADLAEIVRRERESVTRFVAAGTQPRIAQDRVDAELAEAENDRFVAEREALRLEQAFAFALGFDRPVHLDLAEPLSAPAEATDADLESLLADAARDRAEITAAFERMRVRVEDRDVEAWRLGLLPTVRGGARRQGGVHSNTAAVELSLPIFDLGQNAVDAANADLLDAAAELASVTRGVSAQVTDALARAVTTRSTLERFARPQVERRERLRADTERLFHEGQVDLDALVTSLRDEARARRELLDAEAAAAAARVQLDAALGR